MRLTKDICPPRVRPYLTAILLVALATTTPALAQLLAAGPGDLSSDTSIAAPRLKGLEIPRETVALSWPMADDAEIGLAEPFLSRSREYFVEMTAETLVEGVEIYTTAPGALVRLSPSDEAAGGVNERAAIEASALVLIDSAGKSWGAGTGMDLMVGPEQLKAAGAPFAERTSAFRLREDLGAGVFQLRAEGLPHSGDHYVMQVLDRASPIQMTLQTDASDYLHGQTLTVEARLTDGYKNLPVARLEGFVSSPAGRAWPLSFKPSGDGVYRARLRLDAIETPTPGLWEVHASAQSRTAGLEVLRAGRTAFACAVPTARFTGEVRVAADGLGFRLAVDAASAGRYEARGVLWATTTDGTLVPAGIAHSASWIETGSGALVLSLDRKILAEPGLESPFELRDLRLIDQVSMGLLHRQQLALKVE